MRELAPADRGSLDAIFTQPSHHILSHISIHSADHAISPRCRPPLSFPRVRDVPVKWRSSVCSALLRSPLTQCNMQIIPIRVTFSQPCHVRTTARRGQSGSSRVTRKGICEMRAIISRERVSPDGNLIEFRQHPTLFVAQVRVWEEGISSNDLENSVIYCYADATPRKIMVLLDSCRR